MTARSASRRACWTSRITSRALPSCSSSGVRSTSSTITPVPPATVVLGPVVVGDHRQRVLAGLAGGAAGHHLFAVERPVAGLHGLDDLLRVRRRGAGRGGRDDLERSCPATADRSSVRTTSRTLTSSAMMSRERAERVGVRSGDRQRGQGLAHPAAVRLAHRRVAEHTSRTWSIAATSSSSAGRSSRRGQSVRCTLLVRIAVVQAAVELLGDERQQRRGDPADDLAGPCAGCRWRPDRRPRTARGCGGCTSWSARRGTRGRWRRPRTGRSASIASVMSSTSRRVLAST